MLVNVEAIRALEQALATALASLGLHAIEFGRPALVEKAAKEAEIAFQGFAKARPSKEDAYQAGLTFLRGHSIDDRQYDMVASALCVPIKEQQNICVVGSDRISGLLKRYEKDARSGELWRLTWYGLLSSYFFFNPERATEKEKSGWSQLRDLLQQTWPYIDKHNAGPVLPDWVKVMRQESQILTAAAADKYAADFLEGEDEAVHQLAEDLGISESSWFWHYLVLAAVRTCCSYKDSDFKERIPRLLELITTRPVFRDDALEIILTRYHSCSSTSIHKQLCDFVVDKDVWRNPKLKDAGIATAWNRVPVPVWEMVRAWVNEESLRLFFQLLAGRSGSDEGRLAFWSRYLDQLSWTRLVFGAETIDLSRRKPEIKALLMQEHGAYATLTGNKEVDAFMMQIGKYVVVEFSKTGNACNVYPVQQLEFDRYARSYSGGTENLKYGYHGGAALRISHHQGWEDRAEYDLKQLGIHPDRPKVVRRRRVEESSTHPSYSSSSKSTSTHATTSSGDYLSPNPSKFSMAQLNAMVARYPGAHVRDLRDPKNGRLWVEDPRQNGTLSKTLHSWGFKWANKRSAWYYPEN